MKLERFWELSDSAFHDSPNFDLACFCKKSIPKNQQVDGMSSTKIANLLVRIVLELNFLSIMFHDKNPNPKATSGGVDRFSKTCSHKKAGCNFSSHPLPRHPLTPPSNICWTPKTYLKHGSPQETSAWMSRAFKRDMLRSFVFSRTSRACA